MSVMRMLAGLLGMNTEPKHDALAISASDDLLIPAWVRVGGEKRRVFVETTPPNSSELLPRGRLILTVCAIVVPATCSREHFEEWYTKGGRTDDDNPLKGTPLTALKKPQFTDTGITTNMLDMLEEAKEKGVKLKMGLGDD
jgi:hypothetical protein